MPSIFDNKNFNAEVFGKYLETVPRVKQNQFVKAGIFNRRDVKSTFADQTGGNFMTLPMVGLIGGDAVNYDGSTDITATSVDTYVQSMIAYGRAKAWKEKDFAFDVTGTDFMAKIAEQVGDYWDDIQETVILSILKGIFSMSDKKSADFVSEHTLDITGNTTPTVDATTLNNAIQKAAGANKNIFKMVIMHSQVATNLENLQLLQYAKGTDAQGVEKDLAIATWNGRTVLIDDDVPYDSSTGAYTTYVLGENAFDYCDLGAKVPNETYRDALVNGGEDILITRQRKLIAPRGISFVQPSTPIISPLNSDFENAARWALVKNTSGEVINHKAIPIAQIKSMG